jgi:uncharacterized protein (DUF111 family)
VGETAEAGAVETVAQVETTIDDMNPQLYEPLMDRLFEAGALDVLLTPVVMTLSRPGTVLTALCPRDKVSDLSRVLFEESSTIGVRWTEVSRTRLDREMITIVTDYGPLPFKVSRLSGRIVTATRSSPTSSASPRPNPSRSAKSSRRPTPPLAAT